MPDRIEFHVIAGELGQQGIYLIQVTNLKLFICPQFLAVANYNNFGTYILRSIFAGFCANICLCVSKLFATEYCKLDVFELVEDWK